MSGVYTLEAQTIWDQQKVAMDICATSLQPAQLIISIRTEVIISCSENL